MSLIRQIWLLLLATLVLAFVASVTVNVTSARDTLQTQLRLKNSDNATALALVLSQQKGQRELMELVSAAQFDTGFYRSIRFTGADGKVVFSAKRQADPLRAPAWFVALGADRVGAGRGAGLGRLARARLGRGGEPVGIRARRALGQQPGFCRRAGVGRRARGPARGARCGPHPPPARRDRGAGGLAATRRVPDRGRAERARAEAPDAGDELDGARGCEWSSRRRRPRSRACAGRRVAMR